MPIVRIEVPGLAGPRAGSPARRPGSARRTSHVDVVRDGAGGWQSAATVSGTARDVFTPAGGGEPLVARASLFMRTEGPGATVTEVRSEPAEPRLDALVGSLVMVGFRRNAAQAVPDHRDAGTPLHRLLDDAPLAFLVSGHAAMLGDDDGLPRPAEAEGRRRAPTVDLCAGWQAGGTLLGLLEETGSVPHSLGPEAPELSDPEDPLGWHERPVLPPKGTRRTRRMDVWTGEDGLVHLDVHFRDSYADLDGVERSLHEYTLEVTADRRDGTVRSAAAVPRALPWTQCPEAVGSAGRLPGLSLRDLPDIVRREFKGITTCTHLNDTMRSLADAWALHSSTRG